MTNPDSEIRRLMELMPASGRMYCKLMSRPEQPTVIAAEFPRPWKQARPLSINFDLWSKLSRPQRDLLLLRTVSWLMGITWFKPDLPRGLVLAGLVGAVVEVVQADAIGFVTAAALAGLAGTQIWRSNRSSQIELEADEAALQTAERRGYSEADAARHLLGAIEAAARIEGRSNLTFTELLRCQNLRAIAGLSSVTVPNPLRKE
jgi:Protein of unknown function (DUF3318)